MSNPGQAASSTSFVPGQPVTALICRYPLASAASGEKLISSRRSRHPAALVVELNQLPAVALGPSGAFVCSHQLPGTTTVIVFGYARAKPHLVFVEEDCMVVSGPRLARPTATLALLLNAG